MCLRKIGLRTRIARTVQHGMAAHPYLTCAAALLLLAVGTLVCVAVLTLAAVLPFALGMGLL